MRISLLILLLTILLPLMLQVHAELSPAQSIITGFEKGFPSECLWCGVDRTGKIAGYVGGLPVLAAGTIRNEPMPVSVAVGDMNGDGLLDLVAMDELGYLRIYFNSGTKTEPKFTAGELPTLFLSRMGLTDPSLPLAANLHNWTERRIREYLRRGQRIFLTDPLNAKKNDLIIGNYLGEIYSISNAGTGTAPDSKQPSDIAKAAIPTTKKENPAAKIVRGDRDTAVIQNQWIGESKSLEIKFNAGAQWTEVKKEITVQFDEKELADIAQLKPTHEWRIYISFDLAPGAGTLYIDDIKMIESSSFPSAFSVPLANHRELK
jgi:hypothetical protein